MRRQTNVIVELCEKDRELLTKVLEELEHICIGINGPPANSEGEEMTPTPAEEGASHV